MKTEPAKVMTTYVAVIPFMAHDEEKARIAVASVIRRGVGGAVSGGGLLPGEGAAPR